MTKLMRVMQTNACSLSCGYCPTFCGGKVKRVVLAPEEVARTFPSAALAPSAGRSTYRKYASRPAFGRRLAAGPFSTRVFACA